MDDIQITEKRKIDAHFSEIKIVGSADEKEVTRFAEEWCEANSCYLTEIKPVEDYFIARVGSDDYL